jgi:hypothetical protein
MAMLLRPNVLPSRGQKASVDAGLPPPVGLGATFRHAEKSCFARFKDSLVRKAAKKTGIGDTALTVVIREVTQGQADYLGGGVFKKRLNENRHRSIVLTKGGQHWVIAHLYAKKDIANIDPDELAAFRNLAQAYGRMTDIELSFALSQGDLQEIFP